MKILFAVTALAVGFASNLASADSIHRHHHGEAGIMHKTSVAMPDPTSFQGLYQSSNGSQDCRERIFGFCPTR